MVVACGQGDRAGLAGVKDGNVTPFELLLKQIARGVGRRVVDDDDSRLNGFEKGFAQG